MTPIILAFSGYIKSGKTTISQEIANKIDWKTISFGDYLRSIAKQKGLDPSRENLELLGKREIEQGWESFCKNVLSSVNWKKEENLIVDGVRHKEALDALKNITNPSDIYLIYIDTNLKNRIKRSGYSESKLKRFDSHYMEKQVISLIPHISDLIIDGNKKIEEIVLEILEWLHFK